MNRWEEKVPIQNILKLDSNFCINAIGTLSSTDSYYLLGYTFVEFNITSNSTSKFYKFTNTKSRNI